MRAHSTAGPGLLLGLGLGGFLDGIVLHQLLQWHHLVSSTGTGDPSTLGGLETSTVADGAFHLATWALTVAGVWTLVRVASREGTLRSRALLGWTLAGWGVFNVLDSVVNHWVLGLHHIREGVPSQTAYDVSFFALGLVLAAAGATLAARRPLVASGRDHGRRPRAGGGPAGA